MKQKYEKEIWVRVVGENKYLEVGSKFYLTNETKTLYIGMHPSMMGTWPVTIPKKFCEKV